MAKSNPPLLSEADQQPIVAAIARAEAATTGEIRVFVESSCTYVDAMERAKEVFAQLRMHTTEKRNAALIYVALKDRQFAVFGDEGIYPLAGADFWKEAAVEMVSFFRNAAYGEGIAAAVTAIGRVLALYFPENDAANPNELPDDIVFGA